MIQTISVQVLVCDKCGKMLRTNNEKCWHVTDEQDCRYQCGSIKNADGLMLMGKLFGWKITDSQTICPDCC